MKSQGLSVSSLSEQNVAICYSYADMVQMNSSSSSRSSKS